MTNDQEQASPGTDPDPAAGLRQTLEVDIACVGFGPAMGGFLTTLSRGLVKDDGSPAVESAVAPGMPPQVVCYERADGLGFGVSGVVTRGRALRESFPALDPAAIPMAAPVREEKVVYLLDPVGASRRSASLKAADAAIRALRRAKLDAVELPWAPEFLHKDDGYVFSIGQLNQWVAEQLMAGGAVQLWPGTPVAGPLLEGERVVGVRLADQGVARDGTPEAGYMPGLDVKARLTVVGDGPVGAVGRALDEALGMPPGHHVREWAVGCKMVVDLPESLGPDVLPPGFVLHTFGFPEPEIFGFLYVHPERVASVGIFVPSWFDSPVRTSYRYLQHYVQHPYLWRWLRGGRLRSWGAKSLQESGRRGEPRLAGDGFARIGEGSGSTNVLTGSGVDEAWATGAQLGEAVLELLREGKPFTREHLEATYVARRRASWVEEEGKVAERSRDGFQTGVLKGMIGMALAGLTKGALHLGPEPVAPHERVRRAEDFYAGKVPPAEVARLTRECAAKGLPLRDALMDAAGWPPIVHDGQLLVSHQDALLMGGKVQAPPGYADHVTFEQPDLCTQCGARTCVEVCSGQAITPGEHGVPAFDREKCVFCGACLWSCTQPVAPGSERTNLRFRAGAGGLHSAEN